MAKKRKIKKHYTIAVTSDFSGDTTKYYRARFNLFKVAFTVAALVVLVAVGLTVFEFYELDRMESKLRDFKDLVAEQDATIEKLGAEKAELSSANEVLSDKVAKATIQEEQNQAEYEARHLPTLFPLSGSAQIVDPDTFFAGDMDEVTAFYEAILSAKKKEQEQGTVDPYVFFTMADVTDVVAAGDGEVTSVSDDPTFGKCVKIDHGNGYVTIYKSNGDVKVNVGDQVVQKAIIFISGGDDSFLEYQITKDGQYIDPLDVIVIDG
ncbi:MAG: M23 family metallopeptidase [Lachnospiraceae bacterium]|nr:M23 family metallopeptidase [Lachnospiraceae bacterium]